MISQTTNAAVVCTSPDEIAALVRRAIDERTPLADYGIAHAGLGKPAPDNATRFSLESPPAGPILEHYVRDLTVRAAAGATLGQLQAALAKTNQFLPIDADLDLTLGEIIAHNVYGPLRLAYGGPRDLLLGLHYIDGLGRDIHVGGRTVKNVAGIDVTRLMVGSLGELGIVHEATLRTYAIPETAMTVDLTIDDPAALDELITRWLLGDAAPIWLTLERRDARWHGRLGYYGRATACAAQFRSLQTFIEAVPTLHIAGSANITLEADLAQRATRRAWRRSASALVKIVVPPACTGQACVALANFQSSGPRLAIDAIPTHGCIFAGGQLDAVTARQLDATIGPLLDRLGGFSVWYTRPPGSQDIHPFNPMPPETPLLVRLKRVMDPHRIFNPGRLLPLEPPQP